MINLCPRMLEILSSRNIKTNNEIEEFLNPSISLLSNSFEIRGMKDAVSRINRAIEKNESIVIYGDYDADGVCASAILYLYLRTRGAEVNVFIPNRFENGYGLSESTVNYIAENLFPDLVITVDCGITSIAEIELFYDLGIDVVVTDHHLPLQKLPNAVAVVDAKQPNETCVFRDFCGAGVALKLIDALGGNIMDYIDIASIATIGDLVPLLKENRIIASIGLNKINSNECNIGINELKKIATKGEKLSSQDIAFRIVPRINAAGRIESAMLAFNLLVEQSKEKAKELAEQLEQVNSVRIEEISKAMQEIYEKLRVEDISNKNCIIVSSKNIHEGVLGIVATKLVEDYCVPCFVFCETSNGLFKGSCRSTEDIDIHKILLQISHLFLAFGGHAQAAGITIEKEKFDEFKSALVDLLPDRKAATNEPNYDYEISDDEITVEFAKQLDLLEPTGCANEKPVFKISLCGCAYKKTSNPKHYQLITKNNKYFICFNGKGVENSIISGKAKCYFTLSTEIYNNQYRVKPRLDKIYCDGISKLDENEDLALICDLYSSIYSKTKLNILDSKDDCIHLAKQLVKSSGTVIVARTIEELELAKSQLNLNCYLNLPTNQETCIFYCPQDFSIAPNISKYNNIVLLSGTLANKLPLDSHVFSYKTNITNLSTEKKVFADCYRVFCSQKIKETNNIYEYVEDIKKYLPYSKPQIAFVLAVFCELGIIETKGDGDTFLVTVPQNNQKRELSSSVIYRILAN